MLWMCFERVQIMRLDVLSVSFGCVLAMYWMCVCNVLDVCLDMFWMCVLEVLRK